MVDFMETRDAPESCIMYAREKYEQTNGKGGRFWTRTYTYEPESEKTGFQDFLPGPTQTGLYSHRSRLESWNLDTSRRGIVLSVLRKQRR